MSIDLEYAIKKDIRNNPVVREIDREQKREFARTVVLVTAIVGMLLFSATQPFKMVSSGYSIERLRQDLAAEESLRRKLILEIETWRAPELLERRATTELHMIAPGSADMIVLERVPAPSAPDRAIIADARQEQP